MIFKTNCAQDTMLRGREFSSLLTAGGVVVLEGELGTGKTVFVQGVLSGLGYKKKVSSPSYSLMRYYKTKKIDVYHIDLYRLDQDDIFGWGIEDYLNAPGAVALIEWGEKIERYLRCYVKIKFSYLSPDARKIRITRAASLRAL